VTAKDVTLVIPGRDCAATLDLCLGSVVPLLDGPHLERIVLVDDGSVDDTPRIAARYPVTVISGEGRGPGAARNLGWRAAATPLVWFVDSDCVVEEGALDILLGHLRDPAVAGAGGSYGNMRPDSLLACLIHEEIVSRHARMPDRVDFLATFNVVYRRSVLEALGGFDERFVTAEDADFSFRARGAGHALAFDPRSRVRHHHPVDLGAYLRTQYRHGYWRALLYAQHPGMMKGDSYSGAVDHAQPPLAVLSLLLAPAIVMGPLALLEVPVLTALAAAQLPGTARLIGRTGELRYAGYAPMGFARAYWRGVGLARGAIAGARRRLIGRDER